MRLAVTADVGQQFDALRIAHQHAAFVFRSERGEVAGFGHHQFVADVARALDGIVAAFPLQQRFVEIDIDRKLRVGTRELGDG